MKIIAAITLLTTCTIAYSQSDSAEGMLSEATSIYDGLKLYESGTLQDLYIEAKNAISEFESSESESAQLTASESLAKMQLLQAFYDDIEKRKEYWGNQYFRLWERAFYLKGKIEKLYKREELSKNSYGSSYNETITRVYKKEIYFAGESVVKDYLMQLKALPECDYFAKIEVTEQLIDFLMTMDDLYKQANTRELQRNLRKSSSIVEQRELITSFETSTPR